MAKQGKKGKNELDVILEQLKRSFGSDSDNLLEDEFVDSEESEEDEELSEILGKLFSEEVESAPAIVGEKIVDEHQTDEPDEVVNEDEIHEIVADAEAIANALSSESEEVATDAAVSEDIEQVDGVLALMLANGKSGGETEAIAAEPVLEAVISESEVVTEEEVIASLEEMAVIATEIVAEAEAVDTEAVDTEAVETETVVTADVVEVNDTSLLDNVETKEEAASEHIASEEITEELVEDEQSVEVVEEVEEEVEEEVVEEEILILSPDEYIYDPLQIRLSQFFEGSADKNVFAGQNESNDAPKASVGTVESEEQLDENDISLLLKFDYESVVRDNIGEEKTEQIIFDEDNSYSPDKFRPSFGYCGKEFTDRSQIPGIREKYRKDKKILVLMLCALSFITILLIAGTIFLEFFSNKIAVYPWLLLCEFILITIIAMIMYKRIISGYFSLIRFESSRYTLLSYVLTIYIVYDLLSLILFIVDHNKVTGAELVPMGFCVSIYAVSIIFTDLLKCMKESAAFEIISSTDGLYTAESRKEVSVTDKSISKKPEHIFRIRRSELIYGYFKRSTEHRSNINNIILFGIILVISLVAGLTVGFICDSAMRGLSMIFATILLSTPLSVVVSSTITDYAASLLLKKQNTAFIGSGAETNFSKVDAIIFFDNDTVEVTSYTEIHPVKRADTQKSLEIAYEIFRILGGPLASIGKSSSEEEDRVARDLIINSIAENGIDIYFDSSMSVLIGDKKYMEAHNIKVKTDVSLSTAIKGVDTSVIYIAFDGVPKLGFIVNSKVKPDFSAIAETLHAEEIQTFVETYEPQINDSYYMQNNASAPISVIKPEKYEQGQRCKMCAGSLVSANDCFSIVSAIRLAPKIIKQKKLIRLINLLLTVLGAIVSGVLVELICLDNWSWMTDHLSLVVAALMIVGILPGIILGLIFKNKNGDGKSPKRRPEK